MPDEQTECVIGWHWCRNENTAAYYAAGTVEKNASLVMASAFAFRAPELDQDRRVEHINNGLEEGFNTLINQPAPRHVPGAYETRLGMKCYT